MQRINRCRINSWGAVGLLLMTLSFAGCSNEDTGIDYGTDGDAITFDCSTSKSRVPETTADNMQYFRVSAVWNKAGTGYAKFMDNQLVEKQGNDWVYSPIKYWPGYGSVSFFAHSPATSSGMESFQISDATNTVSIGYKVDPNYQRQEDFMVATNLDNASNPIRLDFKHMLSTVRFQARGNDNGATFRIKEIKLSNVYGEGILTGTATGTTSTWAWSVSGLTDYIVYQKHPIETQDPDYVEIGDLMVLPQKPDTDFKITVVYDVVGIPGDRSTEYTTLNPDLAFKMGNKYTFYLDLNI